MFFTYKFSRHLLWRSPEPWVPIPLPNYGASIHSVWTQDDAADPLSVQLRDDQGLLIASRSMVLDDGSPNSDGHEYDDAIHKFVAGLRALSGQARIPRSADVMFQAEIAPASAARVTELGPGMTVRAHYGLPLTKEHCLAADEGPEVDSSFLLLADACEAFHDDDYVRTILYAMFAAEVVSRRCVETLGEQAIAAGQANLRIRGTGAGASDDLFTTLRNNARNNVDITLHELPLYLSNRSVKRDAPPLWQRWSRLKATRNMVAHQGELELTDIDKYFPLSREGAGGALQTAIDIFEWWGQRARHFTYRTSVPYRPPLMPPGTTGMSFILR